MNFDKKAITRTLLFALVFIVIVLGSTFAIFNYTKAGDKNTLSTSTVEFSATSDTLLDVESDFPQDADLSNEELVAMKTNHSGVLSVTGHNTLTDGVKYSIYVIRGDDITGKQRLADSSIKFQLEPDFTSGEDSFTVLTNNYATASNLVFDNNGRALISTGLVKDTTELTTVDYNFYMWLDADSMHVSSTMKRATLAEGNPSLADTTSGNTVADRYMKNDGTLTTDVKLFPASSNEAGKIVYTTNEFSNGYYNIKFLVEAIDAPPPTPTPEPFNSVTYDADCYKITTTSNSTVKIAAYNIGYDDEEGLFEYCPTNNITIPSTFDGKTVTEIGDNAFYDRGFNSVVIPNTVTIIGENAFSNNNLSGTLSLPSGLTTIGDDAFSYNNLSNVTIPNSVTIIGDYAFTNNSLSGTLTIPNSVTTIGEYAFANNSLSGTLTIPNSVTTIEYGAFQYNTGFSSVTIPNSIINYGDNVFENTSIESLSVDIPTIPDNSFYNIGLENLTLGEHVVSIGEYAFAINNLSGTLTISNNVTAIGNHAFADNTGFSSVTIPNSVINYGGAVFDNTSIESLSIDVSTIHYDAFYNVGLENLTLGEHVVSIGSRAFYSNNLSGTLTIPNGVTTIGLEAFEYNDSLFDVTIPNSVTTIENNAFGTATLHFNKSCSSISSMSDYDWGATEVYGSGNELCQ